MAIRWGICAAGLISNDFVTVLKALPSSEHRVVAVATKNSQSKADAFAHKYGIPRAYGSYEDLAKNKDVEIVYVGTIRHFHHQVCLMYLEHGKHVLCEKPMAMSLKECEEIIAKARENNVFFMEGVWTRFFPAYDYMLQEVNSGHYGDIMCVRSSFVCPANKVLQSGGLEMTSGATLMAGVYPVTYVQQFFKERPEKIVAVGQYSNEGGDMGACLTLHYNEGKLAIAYVYAAGATGASTVTFHGTKGTLTVLDDMHAPTSVESTVTGMTRHFSLPNIRGPFNWRRSNGFKYQVDAVRQCLLQGLKECPQMTHEDSLITMYILDEACQQIGATNELPWIPGMSGDDSRVFPDYEVHSR